MTEVNCVLLGKVVKIKSYVKKTYFNNLRTDKKQIDIC